MNLNKAGWVHRPDLIEETLQLLANPYFAISAAPLKDSGVGKVALLYKYVKQLAVTYNYKYQGTGDCVSWGAACAVDTTKSVEILLKGEAEEWTGWTATEIIYGGSRVQIGKGKLGGSAGSLGVWAARFVSEYGTLLRAKYANYDLTEYNTQRAIDWGYRGVPSDLLSLVKEHPIQTVSQITSVEQARDALANGFPVTIAGSRGFYKKRDSKGRSAVNPYDPWAHQMCLTGLNDPEGVMLVENSWPKNWISGPVYLDQPEDSFWATYEDLAYYFKSGDCWSYSSYLGYPKRELNLRII